MSNTTLVGSRSITITGLDADWLAGTDVDWSKIFVKSITFVPSAQNDRLILRDGSITGGEIFDSGLAADTTPIVEYYDPPEVCTPVMDQSECTFGTAASCKVIIRFV